MKNVKESDASKLLDFCLKYPDQWHSYSTDARTVRAIKAVAAKADLETSAFSNQFYFHIER